MHRRWITTGTTRPAIVDHEHAQRLVIVVLAMQKNIPPVIIFDESLPLEATLSNDVRLLALLLRMDAERAQRRTEQCEVACFHELQPHRDVGDALVAATLRVIIRMPLILAAEQHDGRLADEVREPLQHARAEDFAREDFVFFFKREM